jgi:hypothetical protein
MHVLVKFAERRETKVCTHILHSGHGGYGFLALCSSAITFKFWSEYIRIRTYICVCIRILLFTGNTAQEVRYLCAQPPDIPNLETATEYQF